MPVEIRGTRIRVRVRRPVRGARFRTHDVGKKGHTQRIAMRHPRTRRWSTQAWTFPTRDVRKRRPSTMKILKRLGKRRRALSLARK